MSVVRTLFFTGLVALSFASLRAQAPAGTLPTVIAAPGNVALALGATRSTDLTTVFGLPGVTGPVVQMQTTQGVVNLEMFPQTTPLTVANFLYYVNSKLYNGSIVDRDVPGFVIQSGSYTVSTANVLNTIPAQAAVQNEFHLSNLRGTVAMAKLGGDPNSATSAWFISLADNSSNLDNQNGGFTVFARVIGTGMTVADTIAALPIYNLNTSLSTVPLANVPAGATTVAFNNWVRLPSVAPLPIYPDTGVSGVLSFSASSSSPNTVNAAAVGRTLILFASSPGTAAITVTASDGNGNQASSTFNVTVTAFTFTSQPVSQTVANGKPVVFSAPASAAATYQWQLNGAPLAGATSSRLVIGGATTANAGSYTCVATSPSAGAITSQAATLTISSSTDVGRLINLSVLTSNITDSQSLTLGFVIGGGSTNQTVLMRASGPALAPFNLSTPLLPDPLLTLYDSKSVSLATNSGWAATTTNQSAVTAAILATFAFSYNDPTSLDSATVQTLAPSPGYSIVISGKSKDSGTALGEVFDDTPAGTFRAGSTHLLNLSSRLALPVGSSLTAGFTIGGQTAKTVLIRATGPALAAFGIPSTMADPQLTLFQSAGTVIGTNAGWGNDPQIVAAATAVSAFPLTAGSNDSVILITLPTGTYTAQVTSASGGGGAALVEVYEVP